MRQEVQVKKTQYVCDGCDYLMNDPDKTPCITVDVPILYLDVTTEEMHANALFHFHAVREREDGHRDCFRYWAHNPRIMERSLARRGMDEGASNEFLYLMLYVPEDKTGKPDPFRPGIPRKQPAAK